MSWAELIAIGKEAAEMRRDDREKPIVDCPICGLLLEDRREVLNCPMGHWSQRGRARGPLSV